VHAGDIQTTADVEILNPDLYIATVNATGRLAFDITVEQAAVTSRPSATSARSRSA